MGAFRLRMYCLPSEFAQYFEASSASTRSNMASNSVPDGHYAAMNAMEDLEATLARDRKQAQERLRSSCAEITSHLNDMRRELVEQRRISELQAADAQAPHEALRNDMAEQGADLESQLAELGGALASRLQAKIQQITQDFRKDCSAMGDRATELEKSAEWFAGQVHVWRQENAKLHGDVAGLKDPSGRELDKLLDVARDEAKTVHSEVMSLDARVSAVEDAMARDPSRPRFEAMPPKGGLAAQIASRSR